MSWKYDNSNRQQGGYEIDDAVLTVTESEAAQLERPLNRKLFGFVWGLSALLIAALIGRAVFLNVIRGADYQDVARRNSIRSFVIPAPRGIIYDRYGVQLVRNIPSMNIAVIPADLPRDESARKAELDTLRQLFTWESGEFDSVMASLDANSILPILVKEHLSQDESLLFSTKERELPGVTLVTAAERDYADSTIFSHILGYEGKIKQEELDTHPGYLLTDSIGKQGLEKSYESILRGTHGGTEVEVTAAGTAKRGLGIVSPKPGSDLVLNIDAGLQKKAYDTLGSTLASQGLKEGALIAMDPRDGSVLALVSYPGFDNNQFSGGISTDNYRALLNDPSKPLFNRVVSGEYPPGSTIKPFLASAALSERTIDENTTVTSTGSISVGNFVFHDWRVNGVTDVRRAIAVSGDIFFYAVGGGLGAIPGLGMDRMKKYEQLFGFGQKTGIDTTSEADGFLPDPAWKKARIGERWYIGDDYHAAIGQGYVLFTPLQLAAGLCAIANGGTLYTPHIVSQIRDENGQTTPISPEVVRGNFISPDILRVVREGMRQTVTEGTATSLGRDMPVTVAGKTGTAQFGGDQKTHGWFESFAPYDHPEIVMIVLVEGQSEEGYNAVPITKEIYQWYFSPEHQEGR